VQAIGRQPQRAPDGAPGHYECHRPEQTTLYRLVRQHAATFFEEAEDEASAFLPQFVKDEFDPFLGCGSLARGFIHPRYGDCGRDKRGRLQRQASRPLHLVQGAVQGADSGPSGRPRLPCLPVRQWALSMPIPLRLLLAAQPKLVTPLPQIVHRVITRFLHGQAGLKADDADSGADTMDQRFGLAANLNIHLHWLVLDGRYRPRAAGASPTTVESPWVRRWTCASTTSPAATPASCTDHLRQGQRTRGE
jgi:hypothetical protein